MKDLTIQEIEDIFDSLSEEEQQLILNKVSNGEKVNEVIKKTSYISITGSWGRKLILILFHNTLLENE